VSAVRWTHSARRDYRNIIEWLGDMSPAAATRVADAVDNRLAMLVTMPRMGRVGRLEGTRELVISRTPSCINLTTRTTGLSFFVCCMRRNAGLQRANSVRIPLLAALV
jgi:plasmid stabilization system protein ParE